MGKIILIVVVAIWSPFLIMGFLLLPSWLKAKRLGIPIPMIKLAAAKMNNLDPSEFVEYCARLPATLVSKDQIHETVDGLQLIHMTGGDLGTVTEYWQEILDRIPVDFPDLCNATILGEDPLEYRENIDEKNKGLGPRLPQPWTVWPDQQASGLDEVVGWMEGDRLSPNSTVFVPGTRGWTPLIEIPNVRRVIIARLVRENARRKGWRRTG